MSAVFRSGKVTMPFEGIIAGGRNECHTLRSTNQSPKKNQQTPHNIQQRQNALKPSFEKVPKREKQIERVTEQLKDTNEEKIKMVWLILKVGVMG